MVDLLPSCAVITVITSCLKRATVKLVYRLKHAQEKQARLKNHLTFLICCRENHITPTGLKVYLPLRSPGVYKIARRTELALLRLLIRDTRHKKAKSEKEINTLSEEIKTLVKTEQWAELETWCSSTTEKIGSDTKAKQTQKFERLQAKQHSMHQLDQDKIVKNFSHRALTEKEKDVLSRGLDFAITPKQIPTLEIIAATEATANLLNTDTAQLLRHKVSSILSTAKPPRSNLSRELHKLVKSLQDQSIVILPADKGNATIVLDRTDYMDKMESLLEDNAYKKVKRNPTSRIEARISTALKELENKGYITSKERLSLAHQFSTPPPKSTDYQKS